VSASENQGAAPCRLLDHVETDAAGKARQVMESRVLRQQVMRRHEVEAEMPGQSLAESHLDAVAGPRIADEHHACSLLTSVCTGAPVCAWHMPFRRSTALWLHR